MGSANNSRVEIYCCGCSKSVYPRLTSALEIYPHRPDLKGKPMWRCDDCGNYVGCHHKTDTPTRPLGNIPTPEIRKARMSLHALIDPIWKSGKVKRGTVYNKISKAIGYPYHTAEIKSMEQARMIYKHAFKVVERLQQ